jgi:peptidoglycan/LPS O-acetylase OafA/YrhL
MSTSTLANTLGIEKNSFLHSPLGISVLTISFTLWLSASLWNSVIPGGWSIQAEVGHYLVFPLVRKIGLEKIIALAAGTNFLTFFLISISEPANGIQLPHYIQLTIESWIRLNLYATFDYFLLGMICFYWYTKYQEKKVLIDSLNEINVPMSSLILLILSMFIVPLQFGHQRAAIACLIAVIFLSTRIYPFRIFRKFFVLLGKYSYFIYFCHFQVLYALSHLLNFSNHYSTNIISQTTLFLFLLFASLLISVTLGIPSFILFEKPIMRRARLIR